MRFYGLDLTTEVYVKRISYRRFMVLVTRLPETSSTAEFMQNRGLWSLAEGR